MRCACSDGRQPSLSSIDAQSYPEIGVAPGHAAPGSDVSAGSPARLARPPPGPPHYWKPMCVALKYDVAGYSLTGAPHDYAATTTTTAAPDLPDDDLASSTAVTPPPAAALFSTGDRRTCFRQARICRAAAHARCDEHLYEPPANHDPVTSSRDQYRTFVDFAD